MISKRFNSSVTLSVLCIFLMLLILGCVPVTQEPSPEQIGISWEEEKFNVGQRTTVNGPVVSRYYASESKGQPTFINIGNPYPNQNRFTVVIWRGNRGNFPSAPENYYAGKSISVTGLITEYEGVPQIEVTSATQIEIQ